MGMHGTKWRVCPDMSFFPIEKDFFAIGKLLTDGTPQPPFLDPHSSTMSPHSAQFPPGPIVHLRWVSLE